VNVTIICPIHGDFQQLPSNHLKGAGCINCAIESQRTTTPEFIRKAKVEHDDKYDYSDTTYTRATDKVAIVCPKHGGFNQKANNHLNGQGCPKCQTTISSGHTTLAEMLPAEVIIEHNNRTMIPPYEIDLYLPDHKVGIEHHGDFWHSENRHNYEFDRQKCIAKAALAEQKGIRLLQFFEHEVKGKQDVVCSMIHHMIGQSKRIYARECACTTTKNGGFFDENHLFGNRPASHQFSLTLNNTILCSISLSRHPKYDYEIIRFANKIGHSVVGGFSRLLAQAIKKLEPSTIFTYTDRRFGTGHLYARCGFTCKNHTKPNYRYINLNTKQVLSRQQCQKRKLPKILREAFNPAASETANMLENGYGKLWDAGHYIYVYDAPR
jgi:very-short-patch-repair endonuclease